MQNRIHELFKSKPKEILSVYFTAGFPQLGDTVPLCQALAGAGVDMVEIGMPFSDPVADGPTIENSSQVALKNGMSLELLFSQLENVRKTVSIPLLMMGYINPVIQFGVQRFVELCHRVGIDGVILPDLPLEEYSESYREVFEKGNLLNVFLITPQTSDERIRVIDELSDAFIYMVSSSATTGSRMQVDSATEAYFRRVEGLKLKNPTLVGFGIADRDSAKRAGEFSNGVIVGSAFINALKSSNELESTTAKFVKALM